MPPKVYLHPRSTALPPTGPAMFGSSATARYSSGIMQPTNSSPSRMAALFPTIHLSGSGRDSGPCREKCLPGLCMAGFCAMNCPPMYLHRTFTMWRWVLMAPCGSRCRMPASDEDMFRAAIELGCRGYLLKDSATQEIVASLRAVIAGQMYISSAMAAKLVRSNAAPPVALRGAPSSNLTPTERNILRLIAEGKSSKEIGEELSIHYRTVENHRTNICR